MQDQQTSTNQALWAIVAEGFLSRLSFGLVSFALPLYARHLGLKLTEIGVLATINVLASLAVKPLMGWAADRFGLKRSFTSAIGLRSLVALLLAFAGAPWQLFAIRSLYGVAQGLRDPALNALLAEQGGGKRVATGFAWYATAKNVAGSVAGATAGFALALTTSNFTLIFLVAFVMSALPLLVVTLFVHETREERGMAPRSDPEPLSAPRPEPAAGAPHASLSALTVLKYVVLGALISGTAQMLRGLFPVLATEYAGLTEAETGAVYLISAACVLVSGPLFGWLSDNVSRKLVLMVRSAANTLSSIVFIASPTFAGLAVGNAVDDVGKSAFKPAWGALMADVSSVDKQRRAQIMSYLSLSEDLGIISGPILASFVWSLWGVPVALGVRVLLAALTEVYAAFVTRVPDKRRRSQTLVPVEVTSEMPS